jgi:pyruvate,orthophosphate dikinase
MVFGNMGADSATGVAMTRNGSTGEKHIEGDYLINAQGEDVVAGIRMTERYPSLKAGMPAAYEEFEEIAKSWKPITAKCRMWSSPSKRASSGCCRPATAKRTAQAAVRIAVDMAEEGLIPRRSGAAGHARAGGFFSASPIQPERSAGAAKGAPGRQLLATGLNVSPGAAVGVVALDADLAETWAKEEGKAVIMVRPETKPDDVHGMLAAQGILTSRGGAPATPPWWPASSANRPWSGFPP